MGCGTQHSAVLVLTMGPSHLLAYHEMTWTVWGLRQNLANEGVGRLSHVGGTISPLVVGWLFRFRKSKLDEIEQITIVNETSPINEPLRSHKAVTFAHFRQTHCRRLSLRLL